MTVSVIAVFFVAFLISSLCLFIRSELVSMKIVEEPSSYGLNNYNFANQRNDDPKLSMRIKPSNFSGPDHLRRFVGKCFKKELDSSYRYEFCPFSNVTQHELTFRWNPFNGVLGVWQEWIIVNNTFDAMVMREGEKCGSIYRTIKVQFLCGKTHEIMNVSEPTTCNYHMMFSTPYVCHNHSMLVYPTLSETLQKEWDRIESELFREEITTKGYKKQLDKIFEKAGYYLPKATKDKISEQAIHQEKTKEKEEKGEFESLSKCTEEYQKLKKEIEGLRTVLALKDDTNEKEENKENVRKEKKKPIGSKNKREFKVSKFRELLVNKNISKSTTKK